MGFKIKWYCILAQFLYFSISWMQSAEELDYGGPQKYLLIKIVAKDCCKRLLPNLHPEIRNMHLAQTSNNSTSKSYRKIWLGNKSFSRTKNYTTQFIYTIYRGMPHLCADLNALNDQNVIFLRAFANSLLRSSRSIYCWFTSKRSGPHIPLWPQIGSIYLHSNSTSFFFSKNRNPIQFHFPFL